MIIEIIYFFRGLFCKGNVFGFLNHSKYRQVSQGGLYYICKYCFICAKTEAEFDKFFEDGYVSEEWRVNNG